MPACVRVGIPAGIIAFAVTLAANLIVLVLQPADLCRFGPGIIPLSLLAAFVAFLVLAVAAGFLTGRASGAATQAALTGLLVAAISGGALVVVIPFLPAISHRVQELTARCPQTSSFGGGGSFSFNIGPTPPPGFVPPTPPPGLFPSPPPGFFASAPPGVAPPAGVAGIVLEAVGLLVTIGTGMAVATGAASLGGVIGASTRHESA